MNEICFKQYIYSYYVCCFNEIPMEFTKVIYIVGKCFNLLTKEKKEKIFISSYIPCLIAIHNLNLLIKLTNSKIIH